MKHIAGIFVLLCGLLLAACTDNAENPMERDIRTMVKKMTLEEKAGQLVQLSINTITDRSTRLPTGPGPRRSWRRSSGGPCG